MRMGLGETSEGGSYPPGATALGLQDMAGNVWEWTASPPGGSGDRRVIRGGGWLGLGSCPVRFEGDTGWVETGDSANMVASSPDLLIGRGAKIGGYPANFHVRDFLDGVKSRGRTRANADAACYAHIACHCANVALFLKRKVIYDPVKHVFPNDPEANRFRSEALRSPWRI